MLVSGSDVAQRGNGDRPGTSRARQNGEIASLRRQGAPRAARPDREEGEGEGEGEGGEKKERKKRHIETDCLTHDLMTLGLHSKGEIDQTVAF